MRTDMADLYLNWLDQEWWNFRDGRTREAVFTKLCHDAPALRAWALGAAHYANEGPSVSPAFWASGGEVMTDVQGQVVLFPSSAPCKGYKAVLTPQRDYLEHMAIEIGVSAKVGPKAVYDAQCRALADFVHARRSAMDWIRCAA